VGEAAFVVCCFRLSFAFAFFVLRFAIALCYTPLSRFAGLPPQGRADNDNGTNGFSQGAQGLNRKERKTTNKKPRPTKRRGFLFWIPVFFYQSY
jgi:hypothetical protein